MKTNKPSASLPRPSRRWWAFALLLAVILTVTMASAAAQDAPAKQDIPDLFFEDIDEDRILNYEEKPDGTIVDLIPIQDTFTSSGRPNDNFGSDPSLRLGYDEDTGFQAQRIYVQWDIQPIPQTIIINNATMWFYQWAASPPGDPPMNALMRHLTSSWNAGTLTWNSNVPAWGGIVREGSIPVTIGWHSADITDIVQQWVSGSRPNYGVLIQGDETPRERERVFNSRNAGGNKPYLRVDYTIVTDTTPPDAWMIPFPQPAVNVNTVEVKWDGQDNPGGTGIDSFDVQFRPSGGNWTDWLSQTTATSAWFTNDDGTFEFRVRATDRANNLGAWSAPVSIQLDTTVPYSYVLPFSTFVVNPNSFLVQWTGSDGAGTGIQYYDTRYRFNHGDWLNWLGHQTGNSATFNAQNGDGVYDFEVRAVDNVGNIEQYTGLGEAQIIVDAVPPFLSPNIFMPVLVFDSPY